MAVDGLAAPATATARKGWAASPRSQNWSAWDDAAVELAALVAAPRQTPETKNEPKICGVVGEPEAGRVVCQLPEGHEGYHQHGGVRWLGYHPRATEAEETTT